MDRHKPYGFYEQWVKRPQDFICAALAIVVLSPVMVVVALIVRLKLGSPVLFTQERPGKDERIFRLYKFRTMTDEKDESGELLSDKQRLTKFGHLLRFTSLDELPELFNILKGDMAIVGPRPLLVKYLPWYTSEEHQRHNVRPGLTGWAQVNGRNSIESWEKRFALDVDYVNKITFLRDIKIILLTIKKVLISEDIIDPGILDDFDDYRRKQHGHHS